MAIQVDVGGILPLIVFPLIYAPIYVAISLGFNLFFSSTRIINIAYGDLIMLGAYMAYWFYKLYSVPPIATLAVAALVGGAAGYTLYIGLFRKILESKNIPLIEEQSIVATFGLSMAIQGVVAFVWSPTAVSYTYLEQGLPLGGLLIPLNLVFIMFLGLAVTAAIYILLYRSYIGVALRGSIQAPQLAEDIGLNIGRIYMAAAILSVVLPLAAGVAISMRAQIYPSMGVEYLVIALVVTALGGMGNPLGSLVGALLYAIMDSAVSYLLPPGLKLFYLYALFLAILLVRPTGIMGKPYIVR